MSKSGTSPPTRNHGKEMLIYTLKLFNLANDSPLVQALNIEGHEDISSLLEMSEQDIDDLEYLKDGTPTSVPKCQRSCAKTFFGYMSYRQIQKHQIDVD